MICMTGRPEQISFLPEIAEIGAGIELGSYGLVGILSEQDWETRFAMHQAIRAQFRGSIALHGPFIGIDYDHVDHLIRDAVNRRLDMIFDVASKLKASRVVLHSGYNSEVDLLKLQDNWIKRNIGYWHREIRRWADAGIEIALENVIEKSPDLLVQLVNEIDNPFLGLCLDIGHQHLFSELDALEWVVRMGSRLFHIHVHDNDRIGDYHWPIGRGTIDFESFFAVIMRHVPQATVSLEVEGKMELRMDDLHKLASRLMLR